MSWPAVNSNSITTGEHCQTSGHVDAGTQPDLAQGIIELYHHSEAACRPGRTPPASSTPPPLPTPNPTNPQDRSYTYTIIGSAPPGQYATLLDLPTLINPLLPPCPAGAMPEPGA